MHKRPVVARTLARALGQTASQRIWRSVVFAGAMLGTACGGGGDKKVEQPSNSSNMAAPVEPGPEAVPTSATPGSEAGMVNPCAAPAANPCAAPAANPCATIPSAANPCAANPCAATQAANPCAIPAEEPPTKGKRPRGRGHKPTGRGFVLS